MFASSPIVAPPLAEPLLHSSVFGLVVLVFCSGFAVQSELQYVVLSDCPIVNAYQNVHMLSSLLLNQK